mmetsp:Transcript_1232/g.3781  ORF Transcript_1232/g.3781 Transcript_1232/m.3781 type:complete len:216 (-) Transcript_1232:702-1349(-)
MAGGRADTGGGGRAATAGVADESPELARVYAGSGGGASAGAACAVGTPADPPPRGGPRGDAIPLPLPRGIPIPRPGPPLPRGLGKPPPAPPPTRGLIPEVFSGGSAPPLDSGEGADLGLSDDAIRGIGDVYGGAPRPPPGLPPRPPRPAGIMVRGVRGEGSGAWAGTLVSAAGGMARGETCCGGARGELCCCCCSSLEMVLLPGGRSQLDCRVTA